MIIYQVDAFTKEAFSGNPAGVCVLDKPISEANMQQLAAEMNLSETAFLVENDNSFDLRWFTPKAEVKLCGHATLASAHILWTKGYVPKEERIRFMTLSGVLTANMKDGKIALDFPMKPQSPCEPPKGLIESLGVRPTYVGKNEYDYLVVVESPKEVIHVKPDFVRLSLVETRGVILTAQVNHIESKYDFISRFFAPAIGVDEDPVTGSAHCCLGPYWQHILGKDYMRGYQASERGGEIGIEVLKDRVILMGQAITVFECRLAAEGIL